MSIHLQRQIRSTTCAMRPFFNRAPMAWLQRKCACGNHTMAGGECEECSKKKQTLQRASSSQRREGESKVPSVVYEVLRSPGQPLDPATRAFFEPRFGYDFSQVRVHTDAKAAESALAVNALAYTVGDHIVFESGQHAPTMDMGRRLLAHELTHVIQQSGSNVGPDTNGGVRPQDFSFPGRLNPFSITISPTDDSAEKEAELVANHIMRWGNTVVTPATISVTNSLVATLRRQGVGTAPTAQQMREMELRRLAMLPHLALKQWRTLKQSERDQVVWNMTLLYGPPFASEFKKYAKGDKKPRPGFGGALKGPQYTAKWLFNRGYRHAYGEVWVHPSGEYIWVLEPSAGEALAEEPEDMEKKCLTADKCLLDTEDEDECRECCQEAFPDEVSECRKYCDSRCTGKL